MQRKTMMTWGMVALAALWLMVAAFAWFGPNRTYSDTERRKLAQMPQLSEKTLLDGSFMTDFETYTLDQFPRRDGYRQLKALFHRYVLGQRDNNGLYLADGHIGKLEYPLQENQLNHALQTFSRIYERDLKAGSSRIFVAVIPDKGYYLARENGYLAMDYDAMLQKVQAGMPFASYVNLTDALTAEDYYRTDTHWRQERLFEVASRLCQAMDIPSPVRENYRLQESQEPFYGVYYGQAALPLEPDRLYTLENSMLDDCSVYNYESGEINGIYDREKLSGKDPYEVFLSGPVSLMTIENPQAGTDRELILFRDSFGSSLAPLLVQGYSKITLVDIRYLSSGLLSRFVDFHGQDVLFLYSTLVLNNGNTLQ